MNTELRQLHLRGALGAVRVAMHEGREHLVVPVIALMDGVIHAVNAATPERVTIEGLTKAAASWNGRPVVLGHPTRNGRQCSANDPAILESHGIGTIFNSHVEGMKLLMEAWIDVAKATAVKGAAFVQSMRNAEPCEVSVGAFVTTDSVPGVHSLSGKSYKGSWLETIGDHLAMLPGGRGACSIEMGCGAHRAATVHLVTAEGFEVLGGPGSGWTAEGGHTPEAHGGGVTVKGGEKEKGRKSDDARKAAEWKRGIRPGQPVTPALAKSGLRVRHPELGKGTIVNPVVKFDDGKKSAHAIDELRYAEEFEALGDIEGHPFHGNQYSEGGGSNWSDAPGGGKRIVPDVDIFKREKKVDQAKRKFGLTSQDVVRVKRAIGSPGPVQWDDAPHINKAVNWVLNQMKPRSAGMNIKSLRERILALFDTPEQSVSEEAAELVKWNTLRDTHNALGRSWDAVDDLIDELLAAEEAHLTGAGEDAETEIETAKLDAIRTHCMAMSGAVGAILSATYPSLASVEPARYAEALRTLIGARNSAKDKAMIQTMHDHSTALGAECEPRAAAQKDCDRCDGTGQLKIDGKQSDCIACDGEGYKAAASAVTTESGTAAEGGSMKSEKIATLTACPCSGFTNADVKALESFDEARLDGLIAVGAARKKVDDDLKAATDKTAATEAALKTAQAAQIPAEELTELRTLADDKKAADATEHAGIVAQLKAAQTAFTEDELKAKALSELRKLATMARIEPVKDYSGRGVAVPRTAAAQDFTPPNAYDAGIKTLQGKAN